MDESHHMLNQLLRDQQDARMQISNIAKEMDAVVTRKKALEVDAATLRARVRGQRLPDKEYRQIVARQARFARDMLPVEQELSRLKNKKREWVDIEHDLYLRISAIAPTKKMVERGKNDSISALRDKYLSFSEDHTRVNSMRLMAAEFANELTRILAVADD